MAPSGATGAAYGGEELVIYILHEFLADRADGLAHGGAEHHHLFVTWRHAENLLYVCAHV